MTKQITFSIFYVKMIVKPQTEHRHFNQDEQFQSQSVNVIHNYNAFSRNVSSVIVLVKHKVDPIVKTAIL